MTKGVPKSTIETPIDCIVDSSESSEPMIVGFTRRMFA